MRASAVVGVTCAVLVSSQVVLAQGTAEVEAILHQAADTLGMLRTPSEVDRLITMIYSGTGTMTVAGQPCTLDSYRASVRYPIWARRMAVAAVTLVLPTPPLPV